MDAQEVMHMTDYSKITALYQTQNIYAPFTGRKEDAPIAKPQTTKRTRRKSG